VTIEIFMWPRWLCGWWRIREGKAGAWTGQALCR